MQKIMEAHFDIQLIAQDVAKTLKIVPKHVKSIDPTHTAHNRHKQKSKAAVMKTMA